MQMMFLAENRGCSPRTGVMKTAAQTVPVETRRVGFLSMNMFCKQYNEKCNFEV